MPATMITHRRRLHPSRTPSCSAALLFLSWSLSLPSSRCQSTISPHDCVDPNNREVTQRVRRGEATTVCLYVGPGGDWNAGAGGGASDFLDLPENSGVGFQVGVQEVGVQGDAGFPAGGVRYKRFAANLVADEFSSYEVPGSFSAVANTPDEKPLFGSNATHVFAASQSSLSFLRRYYEKATKRIYPFLTAIIDVEDGAVRGIAWDDACVFCEKSECLPNTYNFDGTPATAGQISQPVDGCYLTESQCLGFALDGSNQCDLKLFVVWTGTDVNGKALLSADARFSMFPPNRMRENMQGQVDSMVERLNNLKEKIPGLG